MIRVRSVVLSLFALSLPAASFAGDAVVPALDARAIALHQYFYVDFPRALQSLTDQRQLLEAEVRALELRVASYRPFRSFKQYGATYTADMSWQLELLAARQRLACLANAEADLWRQRSLAAARIAPGQ